MKKVAIVNRTNLINFGSVLQVLALAEGVKNLGYDAEVIWEKGSMFKHLDIRPRKLFSIGLKLLRYPRFIKGTFHDLKYVSKSSFSENTINLFADFVRQNFKRRFFSPSEFKRIGYGDVYHKFICGSDQIWSSTTLYPDPLMYLRFAKKEKRVAYAPSLGRSYIPEYNKKTLKKYISQIPHVSIRETEGARLIKDLITVEVPVVLDPTLLFNKEFWLKYSKEIPEKDFVLCYFLNEPTQSVQEEIIKFAAGKKIIMLRTGLKLIEESYNNYEIPDAGPGEFISYISKSDFIFTDSYHGMIFSINFEKEFLSVERQYGEFDQSTRQKSILELLNIKGNYNKTGKVSRGNLDYKHINKELEKLRESSFQYLKGALQ